MTKGLLNLRTIAVSAFIILLTGSFVYLSYANPGGRTGRTSNLSNGCGSCHGSSASTQVSVSVVSGSGSFTVAPSSVTSFTVTVNTTNTGLQNAGVNLAVKTDQTSNPGTNVGTLTPGTGLRLTGTPQEITQQSPKLLSGGSTSWTFEWTAPTTPGTYYIRVLGFCGDGDGNDDADDRWNWMSVQAITVQAAASVTLLAPNGGEEICAGINLPIRWTADGFDRVRIELSSDGGTTWPTLLINNYDATSGQWIWNIPNNQPAGSQYRVRVLDALDYNTNDASESNFTIYSKTGFSVQPENQALCAGGTAVFRATAIGQNVEYQWRKDGIDIPNATVATLYINNASIDDEGEYRCSAKGLCDSILSEAAILDIKDSPEVTADPLGDTLCVGESIILKVEATGVGLNYAWNVNGQHIPNSNMSEIEIKNVTKADSGLYKCIISGACPPKDTSVAAHVVVFSPIYVSKAPSDEVVVEGSSLILEVVATGTNISYQWKKNGVDIVDSNRSTFTFPAIAIADTGLYSCVVSNRCGKITTKQSRVVVIQEETPIIKLGLTNVDFGNVIVGNTKDTVLLSVIQNNSNVPLTINSIKIIGPDAADFNYFGINLPMTIPAGLYRNLSLEFVPSSMSAKSASVTFNTNAQNVVSISLIGYGTDATEKLEVNDWDFADVLLGDSKTSENIVKNISSDSIRIELPVVMSYDSLNFKLLDDEDYPMTLQAGEQKIINFMFIPTIAKSYEVQVLVANSSANDLWFRLKGNGVTTDITSDSDDYINLFPNPASEFVDIFLDKSMPTAKIDITDIFGANVAEFISKDNHLRWNLKNSQGSKCPPGLYFISIRNGKDLIMNKIIIE